MSFFRTSGGMRVAESPPGNQKRGTDMTLAKFKVGETYSTRSICDYDCIFSFTVVSRTARTVVIKYHNDRIMRRKIRIVGISKTHEAECIDPLGQYSMAPVLIATDSQS